MSIRKRSHSSGFSLVELLIALLVLGIMAAVAVALITAVVNGNKNGGIANSLSTVAGQAGTGTHSDPLKGQTTWYNTKEGAVECLTATTYAGRSGTYMTHTCNWASLKKDVTISSAPDLTGAYVTTAAGLMFCATDAAYGDLNSVSYDCDWLHATKTSARG